MKEIVMIKVRQLSVAALVLSLAAASLSASDNYMVGAGGTQPFYLNAAAYNGAYGNPALLGVYGAPRGGYSFIPVSLGLRSDEFAMSALLSEYMFDLGDDWKPYVNYILWKSYGLKDVNLSKPDKVSQKLTDGMEDGAGVITLGFQTSPIVFSMNGFAGSIRTYADVDVYLPGGALLPIFSDTKGLQDGQALSLSDLSVEGVAATEFAFKMGRPISALPSFFDYAGLDKGAWGVGAKYIMGHSYLSVNAENSSLKYDLDTNDYALDATINILSTGTGLKSMFAKEKPGDDKNTAMIFDNDMIPVAAGGGFGFDAGGVFHNDKHFVSVDMQDIGMIFWGGNSTRKIKLNIHHDSLITDYMNRSDERKEQIKMNPDLEDYGFGEYFDSIMTEGANGAEVDSGKGHTTYLPMSLNLGYAYYHDLSDVETLGFWVKYLTANAGFRWQMVSSPGRDAEATLTVGGSAGLINGIFPLRYGIIVGGPGSVSSVAGVGVSTRYVSFDLYYKSVGHPFMVFDKGFEVATAFTVNWGSDKKKADDTVVERAAVVSIPDTDASQPVFDARIDSAMTLYRSVKTKLDTVTAELDAMDTATVPVPDTESTEADTSSELIPVPVVPELTPDASVPVIPVAP